MTSYGSPEKNAADFAISCNTHSAISKRAGVAMTSVDTAAAIARTTAEECAHGEEDKLQVTVRAEVTLEVCMLTK